MKVTGLISGQQGGYYIKLVIQYTTWGISSSRTYPTISMAKFDAEKILSKVIQSKDIEIEWKEPTHE